MLQTSLLSRTPCCPVDMLLSPPSAHARSLVTHCHSLTVLWLSLEGQITESCRLLPLCTCFCPEILVELSSQGFFTVYRCLESLRHTWFLHLKKVCEALTTFAQSKEQGHGTHLPSMLSFVLHPDLYSAMWLPRGGPHFPALNSSWQCDLFWPLEWGRGGKCQWQS